MARLDEGLTGPGKTEEQAMRCGLFMHLQGGMALLIALGGLSGTLQAEDTPSPTTEVAKWYAEDSSRAPKCQVAHEIEIVCPNIRCALAALKFALLHDPYWKDAKWNEDASLDELRKAAAAALDDPNLVLGWKPDQMPMKMIKKGALFNDARTVDRNLIRFHRHTFLSGNDQDPIEPRPPHAYAVTIAHELVHVCAYRGMDLRDFDLPNGIGLPYDFQKFIVDTPFQAGALGELARVLTKPTAATSIQVGLEDALVTARGHIDAARRLEAELRRALDGIHPAYEDALNSVEAGLLPFADAPIMTADSLRYAAHQVRQETLIVMAHALSLEGAYLDLARVSEEASKKVDRVCALSRDSATAPDEKLGAMREEADRLYQEVASSVGAAVRRVAGVDTKTELAGMLGELKAVDGALDVFRGLVGLRGSLDQAVKAKEALVEGARKAKDLLEKVNGQASAARNALTPFPDDNRVVSLLLEVGSLGVGFKIPATPQEPPSLARARKLITAADEAVKEAESLKTKELLAAGEKALRELEAVSDAGEFSAKSTLELVARAMG